MPQHRAAAADYHTISIRFPQEIFEFIRAYAQEEDRSINEQVVHFIRQALKGKQAEASS